MKTNNILVGLAILGSINLSAYTYEVQPLIGTNFTESGSVLDDSTAFGLRLNKYLSEDTAIMFGYSRIVDADYNKRVVSKSTKGSRSYGLDSCAPEPDTCNVDPCAPAPDLCNSNDNTYDVQTYNNIEDTQQVIADENTQPIEPENTGDLQQTDANLNSSSSTVSTDLDRFYINGLHNIKTSYSKFSPYIYAGFGYERVDNEYNDLRSQGFFDAGLGLKFNINDKVSFIADIQGIKKFRDNDLDVLASLGLGFFFGATNNIAPEVVTSEEVTTPTREITIIKVEQPTIVNVKPKIASTTSEYYIQLAATFNTDVENGCHFTDELKRDGIDYDVKYTTIKGKNASILVTGPYSTKEEAKEELYKIRKISKDAFIRTLR